MGCWAGMAAATAASGAVLPAGVEFAYTAPTPESQTDDNVQVDKDADVDDLRAMLAGLK